jgi:anti-sigma factor RsiW
MPSCREIDPLFAPYIDGAATPAEQAAVEAHLRACPKCRHQTALQSAARESIRTKLCRPCAPDALRTRCRAAARTGPFGIPRTLISVSIAAVLTLVVGGVLLYALTGLSPTVLAAQLTLDHVTCFAVHESQTPVEPSASEARYRRDYGTDAHVPRVSMAGLDLVGLRRCYCAEGAAVHAMYRLDGHPVSLYMIADSNRANASADVFGHDAVIWSGRGLAYVLVSRAPRERLETLRAAIETNP